MGNETADRAVVAEATAFAKTMTELKLKLENGVTADQFAKGAESMAKKLDAIDVLARQMATLVDEKNTVRKQLTNLRKKLRQGVAGTYGDDSAEYQAVGGTRVSERKKPVRKPKVVAPA